MFDRSWLSWLPRVYKSTVALLGENSMIRQWSSTTVARQEHDITTPQEFSKKHVISLARQGPGQKHVKLEAPQGRTPSRLQQRNSKRVAREHRDILSEPQNALEKQEKANTSNVKASECCTVYA